MIIKLLIFLILIYCIYILFFKKYLEPYTGYNSSLIKKDISSVFDIEMVQLSDAFKKIFIDDNFQLDGYIQHNLYIPFPFEEYIKRIIIQYLKSNMNEFKEHELYINNFSELYYKDVDNDRLFIFNINLIDNTNFKVTNLKIKIKIKNIIQFIDFQTNMQNMGSNINYILPRSIYTIENAIELLSIRLDKNNYGKFNIDSIDQLYPNYYEIQNRLGLMEPFLTSSKSMTIKKNDF